MTYTIIIFNVNILKQVVAVAVVVGVGAMFCVQLCLI